MADTQCSERCARKGVRVRLPLLAPKKGMSTYFSIITCTLNSEKYLAECLDSCLIQAYRDFEHIFVDGYSTDSTLSMIEDYIKRSPGINVKVIQSEPRGVSDAMNIGISNSSGKVLHFLHYDDFYFDRHTLAKVKKLFDENPKHKWLIGNKVLKYNNSTVKIKNKFILQNFGEYIGSNIMNWISHAATFTWKELFDEYGYFNTYFKVAMDYDFEMRVIDHEKPLIVNENLTYFRRHESNLSHSVKSLSQITKEDKLVRKTKKRIAKSIV